MDEPRDALPKGSDLLDGRPARARAFMIPKSSDAKPRKAAGRLKQTARTKTDTGRRGEYPKALERMVVKELGNLTPYVRNKGALLRKERAQRKGPGDCLSKTQDCANS